MDCSHKTLITVIGIFLGILGSLFTLVSIHFFVVMLNLFLYIIFTSTREGRITNVIGTFFIISTILVIIELILELILTFRVNLILIKIAGNLTIIASAIAIILYAYDFIKNLLQFIEIKIKK